MADDLDSYIPVRGPARELIDAEELADPDDRVAVILDRRRRRPRYFDDRFLTARDLTRGQQYTLLRQADLAQLSGGGIVHGLDVHTDANGTRLRIDAGLGIARTGESIAVREAVEMTVTKLRVIQPQIRTTQLVAVGAATGPGTGMYVLVARPVEYSRNAVMTFPDGTITKAALADTEIVEGTWFTLMPLPNSGKKEVVARGRARLAREVFVGGFDPTLATDGLCVALIGVVNGHVQWIDQALTGRSVGADAVVGFGLQRRKTRLAYQAQYARHLSEVVEHRRSAGLSDGLPAIEAFAALPPVGPLPRGAVEVTTTEVRQSFFPREIYVEMAIMPDDELPALLSEGMLCAPIDLEAGSEALEGVPVLIVIPVPRASFDQQTPRMEGVYRSPSVALTGRQVVTARPIDALSVLRRKNEPAVWADPLPLDLEAWRKAVESTSQLWYVRRSQFATTSVVVPRIAPTNDDGQPMDEVAGPPAEAIKDAGEEARFNHLFAGASKDALKAINKLLTSKFLEVAASPLDEFSPATETSVYVSAIMGELAYLARRPRPTLASKRLSNAILPTSPVFAEIPVENRLRLRPIELGDVERVTKRFATVPEIGKALRGQLFRSPTLRSVLATSAVVPELAWWITVRKRGADGVNTIAKLAEAADIAGLREIASKVTLPFMRIEPPTRFPLDEVVPAPRIPVDRLAPVPLPPISPELSRDRVSVPVAPVAPVPLVPISPELPAERLEEILPTRADTLVGVEAALSFAILKKIGEDAALRAIWTASHPTFRTRLDESLVKVEQGLQPLRATATLMQILTIGFTLEVETDEQVLAILDALRREGEFEAPNGNTGKVLKYAKHRVRDGVLSAVKTVSGEAVTDAQTRLTKLGFARTRGATWASTNGHDLLALASGSFDHITNIASADAASLEQFAEGALGALEARSVTMMRKALGALASRA
jgi:hypothetical protein